MAEDQLKKRGQIAASAASCLRSGDSMLSSLPTLLRQLLEDDGWREFVTKRGEHVKHERFEDFVTTPPLRGLGGTIEVLERLLKDDAAALSMLTAATKRPRGAKKGNRHAAKTKFDNVQNSNETPAPDGNSKQAALRRLRKDAPALHAKVIAGQLTAHAAAREAGFRPPTATVRLDSMESCASTLRRKLSPEQLAELAHLLLD